MVLGSEDGGRGGSPLLLNLVEVAIVLVEFCFLAPNLLDLFFGVFAIEDRALLAALVHERERE